VCVHTEVVVAVAEKRVSLIAGVGCRCLEGRAGLG